MPGISDTVSELADLCPALAAALARDTSPGDISSAHGWIAATVVNADVLAAMITLDTEIPAAHRSACETLNERWQPRDLKTSLRALPRLAERMHSLGLIPEEKRLIFKTSAWLVLTKRALGLRKPDIPLGYPCPWADTRPENHEDGCMLLAAGDEGFLRPGRDGLQVDWVASAQIYCPTKACGASWGPSQWPLLGRMLRTASRAAS
jgi:hypothetical protein